MECEIGSTTDCAAVTGDQGTFARFCFVGAESTECRNVCHKAAPDSTKHAAVGAACALDTQCDDGLTCDNDTVGTSTCKCEACVPDFDISGIYNGKFTCEGRDGTCYTSDPSSDVLQAVHQHPGASASFTITASDDNMDVGDQFAGKICGNRFEWKETTSGEEGQETGEWTFSDADHWTKTSTGYDDQGAVIYKCIGAGARAPDTAAMPPTCAEYNPTF